MFKKKAINTPIAILIMVLGTSDNDIDINKFLIINSQIIEKKPIIV